MNLVMQTFGRVVRPLFGTGIGRLPFVVPAYKWMWRTFGPKGIVETEANGFKILVDGKDWAVAPSLYFAHTWEKPETELFKNYIKPGMTVVDIGAHVGYFTLLASKLVGDKGRVISFEPTPATLDLLSQNLLDNHITNVELYKNAAADKSSGAYLYPDRVSPASNSMYGDGDKGIYISAVALDDVISAKVDFIKMDIEGGEYWALKGMLDVVERSDNLTMITEVYPEGLKRSGSSLYEYLMLLKKYFKLYFTNGAYVGCDDIERAVRKAGSINLLCRRMS